MENEKNLATEILRELKLNARRWFLAFSFCLILLALSNFAWLHVFQSYDFASYQQDGEGINNINTGTVKGDLINGAKGNDLYVLAYGEHLSQEMSQSWVNSMEYVDAKGNKIKGGKWTLEETVQAAKQFGVDFSKMLECVLDCEWFAVMNMMYADYHKTIGEDVAKYVSLAKDWFGDIDAPGGKTYRFYRLVLGM